MDCNRIMFTGHALRRMFERHIGRSEVVNTVRFGETFAEYPDDDPYPSFLILGFVRGRALHVVAAQDPASATCYVVTAYFPDPGVWEDDFRTRRTL
jgi:hypothetical protein